MDLLLEKNIVCEYKDLYCIRPHIGFFSKDINWVETLDVTEDRFKAIELFGRTCYKSEDKISTTSAEQFVSNLVKAGHESVLEHIVITVKFVGSRNMSHQLVRHRLGAFSQESQRYCNYGKDEKLCVIVPDSFIDTDLQRSFLDSVNSLFLKYKEFTSNNVHAEDARYILPSCCKTEIVVSFNLRQWRHFIDVRCSPRAQWEIRFLAEQIYAELSQKLPCAFPYK